MIEVRDLWFRYATAIDCAIKSASCALESAGVTAIVGRSGVGKSTFMGILSGIYTADDEVVGRLDGTISLDGLRPEEIRRPDVVSWVPQAPILLDHLTIFDNVALPLTIQGLTRHSRDACDRLIGELELSDYSTARPRELSGGMRTRVSVARALVSQPRYLFLDEPFVSLDVANRWNMYRIIYAERKKERQSTVMTTHDIPEALLLADRILLIQDGRNTTHIEVIRNRPLDIGSSSMEDALAEARKLAPAVESQIYNM